MYQVLRLERKQSTDSVPQYKGPGIVMTTSPSLLAAIKYEEELDSDDTVNNHYWYVVVEDYIYTIAKMTKLFYIFAVLNYNKHIKTIPSLDEAEDLNDPPEIIYEDDTIPTEEKFRIRLLLECDEFWDD